MEPGLHFLKIPVKLSPCDKRNALLSTIKSIDCRLQDVTETVLIKLLSLGNCFIDAHTSTQILNVATEYILTDKRFDESLFHF